MVKWFKALFAWKDIKECGVYLYQENSITSKRRIFRVIQGGWSPIDRKWLENG